MVAKPEWLVERHTDVLLPPGTIKAGESVTLHHALDAVGYYLTPGGLKLPASCKPKPYQLFYPKGILKPKDIIQGETYYSSEWDSIYIDENEDWP